MAPEAVPSGLAGAFRRWRASRSGAPALAARAASLSRPGSYEVNQDAAGEAQTDGLALYALADGLGGHAGGEIAARLAVEQCLTRFRARPSLESGSLAALVLDAHRAVTAAAARARDGEGLRSTLVLLVRSGDAARWAHLGDSRLYHFRDGRVRTRTRDHSVPEMLHRAGEIAEAEIRGHPDRSRLLQALGQEAAPRLSVSDLLPLAAGDAFLLCSDGWWEHVPEEAMEETLAGAAGPEEWLARMAEVAERADAGVRDNYTALAVMIG